MKAIEVCLDCGRVAGAHAQNCPLLLAVFKAKRANQKQREVVKR